MSTFGIYFTVLTVGMVLYYVVIIAFDLFRKEGKKDDGVEEFQVPDDDVETSTSVSLVDGGIRFGDRPEEEESPVPGDEPRAGDFDGDGDDPALFDAPDDETAFDDYHDGEELTEEQYAVLKQQMEANMEPAEPDYQTVYDSTAFHMVMRAPRNARQKVLRTYTSEQL